MGVACISSEKLSYVTFIFLTDLIVKFAVFRNSPCGQHRAAAGGSRFSETSLTTRGFSHKTEAFTLRYANKILFTKLQLILLVDNMCVDDFIIFIRRSPFDSLVTNGSIVKCL
jgi:hypothetical protein